MRVRSHCLVGQHRAGKSTLVKVLSGAAGWPTAPCSSRDAGWSLSRRRAPNDQGIGIVYQDLSFIPHLNAVENIFTGRMIRRPLGRLDHREMERQAERLLESLECSIDVRVPLSKLKPAQQHMVELARALALSPKVLILDELSNKLTPVEMKVVYRTVLDLREGGCGIIYISHDMDEILRLADRITVLRAGDRRLTTEPKGLDRFRLHELTYSFSLDELQSVRSDTPSNG